MHAGVQDTRHGSGGMTAADREAASRDADRFVLRTLGACVSTEPVRRRENADSHVPAVAARELPTVKSLSLFVKVRQAPAASLVAYKTTADVVSKMVTLVVTVAAARTLSASDFGVMALAMTTGWLLGVATDAGLPMYLATRAARARRGTAGGIVNAVMQWRWRLGAAGAAAGALIGAVLVPGTAMLPFLLIVLHQLFGAVLDTLAHAYRGLGRTDIESSLSLVHRGAIALAALTVLAVAPSLLALSIALVVPPLVAVMVSRRIARGLTGADSSARVQAQDASITTRRFLRDVAPLGLGVLLSALYFRCDVFFLERLHGVETVGLYNAAFRIVDALRLFPAALLAVAYPTLCAAASFATIRRLALALLAASVPVLAMLYFSAEPLLVLVYGSAYGEGAAALRVLALCIPLFFVNYALTHQLIAWGGERRYLVVSLVALASTLVANALLIPQGATVGAAQATLVTEIVVLAMCIAGLRRQR
jgi:O-antigen/teichoic acid export membrane protein